ncbi:uncharacterized protein LOC141680444 [Apium graveolens]|uniref:uncharacterized protein LOC141680444 n=1 Tax=Apium graveolens TaxID=4045 RepID=UPI003D7B1DE8
MKRILHRYATISGQLINYDKSAVTFLANTRQETRIEVCTELGVQQKIDPGKYLGMPMRIGANKTAVFSFLGDRIEQKLQAWKMQNISKEGKVTLLKTAAQSIPNFWMSLLRVPVEICTKIERKMNGYWWGGGDDQRGIRWLKWDTLCDVKEVGG